MRCDTRTSEQDLRLRLRLDLRRLFYRRVRASSTVNLETATVFVRGVDRVLL